MSEGKEGRVSNTCYKESEKTIGTWVLIFPLAVTVLFLIGFIYELSMNAWDFMALTWYGWVQGIFLVLGVLSFLLGLILIRSKKNCPV